MLLHKERELSLEECLLTSEKDVSFGNAFGAIDRELRISFKRAQTDHRYDYIYVFYGTDVGVNL